MSIFNKSNINIAIEYLIHQYENGSYTLPEWQRKDCWSLEYKKKLIMSILKGIDIPKIYIGEIRGSERIKYIIDGGHRTRAISEFKKNEFSITHNGQKCFYNLETEHDTRNMGKLTPEELNRFNNYEINITKYLDITENDCRSLFNVLQNAQPMTVPDIINSHQSDLVDYLRELLFSPRIHNSNGANFSELYMYYKKTFRNQGNNDDLEQLVSFYTIVNPIRQGEDIENEDKQIAMKYLEKGKTRDSKCLKYIRNHTILVSQEVKDDFEDKIKYIIDCIDQKHILLSDLNSLLYAYCWNDQFNREALYEFIDLVNSYIQLKKTASKYFKEGNTELATDVLEESDSLNAEHGYDLEEWKKSRTSGGSNEKGMLARNNIILEHC